MNGLATNDTAIVSNQGAIMAITTAISEPRTAPCPKPFYKDMSAQVFVGMAVGALIGWLGPSQRI